MAGTSPPRLLRLALAFCLFELAFYVAYRYAMAFSQASASPFWFPDSVLLCALLLTRPRHWWLVVVGTLPIRLFADVAGEIPTWFLLVTFAIDAARGVVTAVALRRVLRNPLRLETVREFALFGLIAVVLAPAVFALAGATARHVRGHDFWPAWEQWFLGNALAHLVVTPLVLYAVLAVGQRRVRLPSAARCLEAVLLAAGLVATTYLALDGGSQSLALTEPRFYAPVPFLFWAALRFGMLGAAGAVAILAFLSVTAALDGRGPFAGLSPATTAAALQHFLLLRTVPLYLVAILIEQRTRIEQSLREAQERMSLAVTAADLALWEWDIVRDEIWFQPSRAHVDLGRAPHLDLDGFLKSVHPDDRGDVTHALARAMNGSGDYESEYRIVLADAQIRWIAAVGRVEFDAEQRPLRLRGISRDITRSRQVVQEVQQQREALAHLSRVTVLGELSGSLAHELNQPLTAILSNAQAGQRLLAQEPVDLAELRAILDDIVTDDRRAGEIIHRLRQLFRQGEMLRQPLAMNELVRYVLKLARGELLARGVELSTDLAEDLPPVSGDRVQLQQVLLNLITNACHAMADTEAAGRRLTVRTGLSASGVWVTVVDDGPGIAPEHMSRIFEPFFTTRPEGMGLGLTVCRTIIGAHKGMLWAENNAVRGASFHVVLPGADDAPV
jgi:signal transduction histidine kinase